MEQETTTATIPTPTEPTAAAPVPNPEPSKPIEMAKGPTSKLTMMVAGILLLLVIAAGVYAYTSGLFSQSGVPEATSGSQGSQATTSDDIKALDDTATQVGTDLNDINATSNDLDNIDLSNDDTPAL